MVCMFTLFTPFRLLNSLTLIKTFSTSLCITALAHCNDCVRVCLCVTTCLGKAYDVLITFDLWIWVDGRAGGGGVYPLFHRTHGREVCGLSGFREPAHINGKQEMEWSVWVRQISPALRVVQTEAAGVIMIPFECVGLLGNSGFTCGPTYVHT